MINNLTIGIPTFKRPDLLKRALHTLSTSNKKNFKKLNIIVSVDGIDENYESYKLIEKNYSEYSNIIFIYQKTNIGSLNNFFYLRDICSTKYFMWLSDDDEINIDTIIDLLKKLKMSDAISIVPTWELVNKDNNRIKIVPTYFNNKSVFIRVLKYLNDADDVFFYGIHKTANLKKCKFDNYWWPNKNSLSNWCYVFQFDLILQGKIIYSQNNMLCWINHDYGDKFYLQSTKHPIYRHFAYFIRRLNIYYLYLIKILHWKKFSIFFPVLIISFIFLLRDLIFKPPIYKRIKF